jgi:formate dehydrogenase subunit gamma
MPVGAWDAQTGGEIIGRDADRPGALLPMLHALQAAFGHIPDEAVPLIAHALNLTRAEVHGVITFYHDLRRTPGPVRVLKLCQSEACQSRGSAALTAQAEDRLGVKLHGVTADGRLGLEPVYCLGLCATAPSAMLDGKPVGRLTPQRLDALLMEASR